TKCDDHVTGELLLDIKSKENLISSEIINLEELCSQGEFTVGEFELIDQIKAQIRVNNEIIVEKVLTTGNGLDTDREDYYSYLEITSESPYIKYDAI
ncbi:hypothetical protein L4C36_01595, partial [Photobacterium japonica]|uniref:hypothetical protein n=1 Tax=Photobacterium japonica TaxID=2910235 RepID=UPI003D0B2F84